MPAPKDLVRCKEWKEKLSKALKGRKIPPFLEEHKKRISEAKKTGRFEKCIFCGKEFWVIKSLWNIRKYCNFNCYLEADLRARIRELGKNAQKHKTEQERRQANLASGRKCYRNHIEQRKFYYRQLNHKRRNIEGSHSLKEWEDKKKKFDYTCLMCKKREPEIRLEEDHIIPISKWKEWKEKYPEIKYECNDIENIQPLCEYCNAKKGNKLIDIGNIAMAKYILERQGLSAWEASAECWNN